MTSMQKEPTLIDTHAHIYYDDLYSTIDHVLDSCIENGIQRIYMPNVDRESIEKMIEIEKKFPENCFSMMGLHPCSVKKNFKEELQIVEEWLSKRKFVAIGEIGIDYFWTREFDKEQEEAFNFQLDLAEQYGLPIAIHSRDSLDKVIQILQHRKQEYKGVLHCFTGTVDQAHALIDLGLFLGIGGVVTFKNSGLDKVVAVLDVKNLVLETDSPYLAPAPYRGKPNSPVYLPLVARKISELKNLSIEEVADITTKNALQLFS